ncbi:General alpha-glucoside permease [Colletotrichum sp. SAR 10_70]|nr:General alpha-glucoside permease [Colletotrichum sp. SAR 10_71]KAI8171492.1 General alpha-glucoside permease [Colletotrichum sp. SAR 10_70]KAI8176906.1 General alpha-glucoside permease [Colletotrichum sp. SAR 10_75]KAI8209669.1 General alpha-glucoside permease [Colletotrichum sp. SAR 10_76]KAI8233480.1 General alpha-glucoside permease [Colletotrichum sp. SAR 10_77]
MVTVGPVCYPIVAETPSGRLRYKTIVIGRFVYNVTGIVEHTLTPRMISPIETKDRTFGELDILFENKIPARKFKYTTVDQFAGRNEIVGKEEEMA